MDIKISGTIGKDYGDVYTQEVILALSALSRFNKAIKAAMESRIQRRAEREEQKALIGFLAPESFIPGTTIKVKDAREGKFEGAIIPADLQRQ